MVMYRVGKCFGTGYGVRCSPHYGPQCCPRYGPRCGPRYGPRCGPRYGPLYGPRYGPPMMWPTLWPTHDVAHVIAHDVAHVMAHPWCGPRYGPRCSIRWDPRYTHHLVRYLLLLTSPLILCNKLSLSKYVYVSQGMKTTTFSYNIPSKWKLSRQKICSYSVYSIL